MSPLALVEIWCLYSYGFGPKSKKQIRGSNDISVSVEYDVVDDVVGGGGRVGRGESLLTTMLRQRTRGLVPQSQSVATTRFVVGHRRDQGLRRSLSVLVHSFCQCQ